MSSGVPANENITDFLINGDPAQLMLNAPGWVTTGFNPSLQGQQAFIQVTIDNHPPITKGVVVPQCDGKKLTFSGYCEAANNAPVAEVWWLPGTDTLNSISINGNPANIVLSEAGHAKVELDASLKGQPVAMEVCIQGRPCVTKNFIGAKCEPGDVMAAAMCHPSTNKPM
ncbi:hypothetical protein EG834_21140, partial [bacterium]|nr:hypothetical protein [bacterium]